VQKGGFSIYLDIPDIVLEVEVSRKSDVNGMRLEGRKY